MPKGPRILLHGGIKLERLDQPPLKMAGQHWYTYRPTNENDRRIFERSGETGRVIETTQA